MINNVAQRKHPNTEAVHYSSQFEQAAVVGRDPFAPLIISLIMETSLFKLRPYVPGNSRHNKLTAPVTQYLPLVLPVTV